MYSLKRSILSGLCSAGMLLASHQALATSIQTLGAGSAVTSADLSANFNSLNEGDNVGAYTEGGLSVTTPTVVYLSFDPFNGAGDGSAFFYPWGGVNNAWVTIKTNSLDLMYGVEFLYGNGWTSDGPTFNWQTLDASNNVISAGSYAGLARGSIVGISDVGGFTTLQVAANYSSSEIPPGFQAIALDNLRVQTNASASVPETGATVALFGAVLLGLVGIRRKLAAS